MMLAGEGQPAQGTPGAPLAPVQAPAMSMWQQIAVSVIVAVTTSLILEKILGRKR